MGREGCVRREVSVRKNGIRRDRTQAHGRHPFGQATSHQRPAGRGRGAWGARGAFARRFLSTKSVIWMLAGSSIAPVTCAIRAYASPDGRKRGTYGGPRGTYELRGPPGVEPLESMAYDHEGGPEGRFLPPSPRTRKRWHPGVGPGGGKPSGGLCPRNPSEGGHSPGGGHPFGGGGRLLSVAGVRPRGQGS